MRPINLGNHDQKSLPDCQEISPLPESLNIDQPQGVCDPARPPECDPDPENPLQPNQKEVHQRPDLGWLDGLGNKKTGIGQHALCDPMQTGHIINSIENPDRQTVYRYTKAIRGTDEAVMDMFRDVIVIDEESKAHPVPIIYGSQEKAVAAIIQSNVRKDNSLVVDRIKLPMLAIHQSSLDFHQERYIYHKAIDYLRSHRPDWKPGFAIREKYERDTVFGVARGLPINIGYTLYAWTWYLEDMNQIVEQIMLKFSPIAYIRVRGVSWETGVKLDSISNNVETDVQENEVRIIKFSFNMTAESFIPQPITRRKAVLKMNTDVMNSVEPSEVSEVLMRLEEAVKELEC